MIDKKSFKAQQEQQNTLKLREKLSELPSFCAEYFRGIDSVSSSLTKLKYASDFKTFFHYVLSELPAFSDKNITTFTLDDLDKITSENIEMFLDYLNYYIRDEKEFENHEKAKARKLSSLRSLFKYFYKKGRLNANVTALVDLPKRHDKAILRLEVDEVARLIDMVESGEQLTEKQKKYHKYTRLRDTAIITLFLGTGIRISECVGLNLSHIDFETDSFLITRKGGNESTLFLGVEVRAALLDYIKERKKMEAAEGDEDALFLSLQNKRISIRAVQNLVAKYAHIITPLKKISPHKLRSTFGTNLYQETGDIYLVADVLDHKDVNTTRKHYAQMSQENRRKAAQVIRLRDDPPD